MYDSGAVSGGALSAGALAATGAVSGQWWLIAATLIFAGAGLLLIRLSTRKAIKRAPIASWDDLDNAVGVDPHGWD